MNEWRVVAGALALLVLGVAGPGQAADDVKETFFRTAGVSDHRAYFSELPLETVDPFSGVLSLVHTDLTLPGKGGHDLKLVRAYSSKIWGRADYTNANEALIAEKELSPLGYGWSLHMGKLHHPNAQQSLNTCTGGNPFYEAPDGSRINFFWRTDGKWVSKNYWVLDPYCTANSACMWTDTGVKHEFSYSTLYFYGNVLNTDNRILPATTITDVYGNTQTMTYFTNAPGVLQSITDSHGRVINFTFNTTDQRITAMTVNGATYSFLYTSYDTGWVGQKKFLTEVKPPVGPSWKYTYVTTGTANENRNGLKSVTFPAGGTLTYTYSAVNFWTGYQTVKFNPVTSRVAGGRGIPAGTWTYAYSSSSTNTTGDTTTITRPDAKTEVYKFTGFAAAGGYGNIWKVGLPISISRGSGAQLEEFTWDKSAPLANVSDRLRAPVFSTCGGTQRDDYIWVPRLVTRKVTVDGKPYTTSYSNFDDYTQPKTITETGHLTRTRTLTYWYNTANSLLRGRPATEQVCIGTSCYSNSWTYDTKGNRTQETLSGLTTLYTFDTTGNITKVTDPEGGSLSLSTYTNGTPRTLNYNGRYTVSRTVNWNGWVTGVTNGRLHTTSYSYDTLGRMTQKTPPTGAATTTSYATDGSYVRQTRDTYWVQTNLDGFGRTTGTVDSLGTKTSVTYDTLGAAAYRSYPYTTTSVGDTLTFDALGRITKVTHSDGTYVQNTYAADHVQVRNERGYVTTFHHQAFGSPEDKRLQKVVDAAGNTTLYTYNTPGALTAVDAPGTSGDRAYGYNSYNFLISETNPEMGTITYLRNKMGQMTSRTDARGTTTFGYDGVHRLTSINYPGTADDVSLAYDAASNVTSLSSANGGAFAYTYDSAHRLTQQSLTLDGRVYTTSYAYNTKDCITSMTYPTGTVLSLTCDAASRPTAITGYVSGITYDPAGQPTAMTFGNTKATTLGYDARRRITSVTSTGITGISYTYDGSNNVLTYNNSVTASNRTLGYDVLDRLTSATGPWGSASYTYDALGNRLSKTEAGSTTHYTYSATTGRLASATGSEPGTYAFDAVGNLTSGDGFTYAWDTANRLASSSDGAAYLYDGRGYRVKKVTSAETTVYHYDHGGNLIAETRGDGTRLRDYVNLGSKLIAMDGCDESGACGVRRYHHTDGLGSVVAMTDAAGAVVCRDEYRPFGGLHSTWAGCGERKYNGRILDEGTGLYYYGSRYYDAQKGRFISADIIRGEQENPQSSNRYAYVLNNPYRYVDPTGQRAIFAGVQPVFTGWRQILPANRLAAWWYNSNFKSDTVVNAYVSTRTRESDEARVERFASYAAGRATWDSLSKEDKAELHKGVEAIKKEKGDVYAHSGGGASSSAALTRLAEEGGYDGTIRVDIREAVWSQEVQQRLTEKYGSRIQFTDNGVAGQQGSDTYQYIVSKVVSAGQTPAKTVSIPGATDHMDVFVPKKVKKPVRRHGPRRH